MKKITRRTVLAIGGLIAAPFVVRLLLRGDKKRVDDRLAELAYGKLDVPSERVDTDCSREELGRAFEIFTKERQRWLSFRKVEGNAAIHLLNLDSKQESSREGLLTFSVDYPEHSDRQFGSLSPSRIGVQFVGSNSLSSNWSQKIEGRKLVFDGDDSRRLEADSVLQILTWATSALSSVSNGQFWALLGLMSITKDSQRPEPDSYVFGPNGKLTSDGFLIPTWSFTDGRLSAHIIKRKPKESYPEVLLGDMAEHQGFIFPRKLVLNPQSNGGKLVGDQQIRVTLICSDINVAHSPMTTQ